HGMIAASTHEEFAVRTDSQTVNVIAMTLQDLQRPSFGHFPEPHRAVDSAARQKSAVRTERQAKDAVQLLTAVPIERLQMSAGRQAPQSHGTVTAAACQHLSIGANGQRGNSSLMAFKGG